MSFLGATRSVALDSGMDGLAKTLASNRLTPEVITNYTRIVFKDRLEVLSGYKGDYAQFDTIRNLYSDLIQTANQYYDVVLIDLDKGLDIITKVLLENANLIVYSLNQKKSNVDHYMKLKTDGFLKDKQVLPFIGKYDKFSKYNAKNVGRYLKQKGALDAISYNTLFFEASNEGRVADFFLKTKTIRREDDSNVKFTEEINKLIENMIYKLQEAQMKM